MFRPTPSCCNPASPASDIGVNLVARRPFSRRSRGFAVVLALGVAACSTAPPPPPADTSASIRRDTEPLTKRFPAIGSPVAATWVTWNSASRGVPGPTTYWLDAVVTLPSQTTSALVTDLQPAAEGKTPAVAEVLRTAVPPGPFLTGMALNSALSTSGWATTAYLDPARNQLVLNAIDD